MYGKELILDLHECNVSLFNRAAIERYMVEICVIIDMERCELHIWDDEGLPKEERQTSPQTKGTSAVQFILTSNITIHTLDLLGKVFVNIFSCKEFDAKRAMQFTSEYFGGRIEHRQCVTRH